MIKTTSARYWILILSFGIFYSAQCGAQASDSQMTKKQSCFLMRETIASVPTWRDNGVPLEKSLQNIRDAAAKTVGYPDEEKERWVRIGEGAYNSKSNSAQVRLMIGGKCEYIPLEKGDVGFVESPASKPLTDEENKKGRYCYMKGHLYMQSALQRDSGGSPQKSFEWFTSDKSWDVVPLAEIKKAINQIYFDPAFAYAGGDALFNQVTDICMNGPKKWKPLK